MRRGGGWGEAGERERILESMVDVWDPQTVLGCRMARFAREFTTENSLQDAIFMAVCVFSTKNQIAEDDARFDSSTSIRRQYNAV